RRRAEDLGARVPVLLAGRPDRARVDRAGPVRVSLRRRHAHADRRAADGEGHHQEWAGPPRHPHRRLLCVRARGPGGWVLKRCVRPFGGRSGGFSLLEVMMAVAILGGALTAILSAQASIAASNKI